MADKNIYQSLNEAMNEIGAVSKGSVNKFDGYKFRGIDEVMNALQPALRKSGITMVPTVIERYREDRMSKKGEPMIYTLLTVRYTFYALDGSSVEAVVVGEAMDRSDKSTNKAMSAAFKYAAFQVLCIPTEEMMDADHETPLPAPKETVSPEEAKTLKDLIEATGTDVKKILAFYKADCVDNMSKSAYRHAMNVLEKKEGGKNE